MRESILETALRKWADQRGHPASEQEFYEQLQAEAEVAQTIGFSDEAVEETIKELERKGMDLSPGSPDRETLRRVMKGKAWESDLSWNIETPTGIVLYRARFRESVQGLPNQQAYREHLAQTEGLPEEAILLYHGKRIDPKQKMGREKRASQSTIQLYGRFEKGIPTFALDLSNQQFHNALSLDLRRGANPKGAVAFCKSLQDYEQQDWRIPRTAESYGRVLDAFGRVIDTEQESSS